MLLDHLDMMRYILSYSKKTLKERFIDRCIPLLQGHMTSFKKLVQRCQKTQAGYYLWNVYDKARDVFDLSKLFVGSQGTLGLIDNLSSCSTFQTLGYGCGFFRLN